MATLAASKSPIEGAARFGSKADICGAKSDGAYGPKADIAALAARCGAHSHLVFPIDRSLLQFDGRRKKPMIKRYHPERHYMRGPGPKWLEKHSGGIDRIGRVTDDRRGDKRSLTGFFLQLLRGRRRLGVAV